MLTFNKKNLILLCALGFFLSCSFSLVSRMHEKKILAKHEVSQLAESNSKDRYCNMDFARCGSNFNLCHDHYCYKFSNTCPTGYFLVCENKIANPLKQTTYEDSSSKCADKCNNQSKCDRFDYYPRHGECVLGEQNPEKKKSLAQKNLSQYYFNHAVCYKKCA